MILYILLDTALSDIFQVILNDETLVASQTILTDVCCFAAGDSGTIFVIIGGPKMNVGVWMKLKPDLKKLEKLYDVIRSVYLTLIKAVV